MARPPAASLLSVLLALAPLLAAGHTPCKFSGSSFVWTGASSIPPNVTSQLQSFVGSNYGASLPDFISSTSPTAAACLNTCVCILGFSDQPLEGPQNSLWGAEKVTIPLFIQTYNFFTSGNTLRRPVRLTTGSSYQIFKAAGQTWGKFRTNLGLQPFARNQRILRAARSLQSAQYALAQQLWTKSGAGYSGPQDGTPFPASWGIDFQGANTLEVGKYIAANRGAIGFGSVALLKTVKGTVEALLKNKAGQWVNERRWSPLAAIPQPWAIPAPTANWAGFSLVFNGGSQTPAAASFTYGFARVKSNGDEGKASAARAVLKGFLDAKFAKILADNSVFPLPSNLTSTWGSYIDKVQV